MKESETQDDEIEADEDGDDVTQKKKKQSKEVVTSEMVDSWCNAIKEHGKLNEKKSGASPLSRYVATLREVAQQRNASLPEYSSVLVGEHSSVFGSKGRESDEDGTRDEEGTAVFSSSWLPGLSARTKLPWMKILFRSWYSVLMEKTGL
ncbi:hypothetical protein ACFX13_029473 [Malus domestica]